jgi:3-oxoacyl-ACP reductase-like protein
MEKRFQDKVAFITGGGSGIGAATAIMLAREGAAVVMGWPFVCVIGADCTTGHI